MNTLEASHFNPNIPLSAVKSESPANKYLLA